MQVICIDVYGQFSYFADCSAESKLKNVVSK